jgi:predicted anti-sigma-YlaC factor YlaD
MNIALKEVGQWISDRWLCLGIAIVQVIFPVLAFADGGLDDPSGGTDAGAVAQKVTGEISSGETLLWGATKIAGIITVMSGLVLWHRISTEKSQKKRSAAVAAIIIGSALFFLHTVIELAGNSTLSA